ncbi:MAG TPA: GNAT family N-acetyltransferase [Pseudoxanthomonas sp.]
MDLSELQLDTPRLLLRLPRREDYEAWAAFATDEETMRYIGGTQARSPAWRSLAATLGSWHLQGFGMFSVIEKATGRWIGRVGPWQPEGWPGTEVGWSIAREAWGHGYAPEAATASVDWAFDHLGWEDVIHTIDPQNANSKAVAAKLGSTYLRMDRLPEPHHEKPVEVWGQTRAQWQARRVAQP